MAAETQEGSHMEERRERLEKKPVREVLQRGDMEEMGRLVLDILHDRDDDEVWTRLVKGQATIEDIAYEGKEAALSGEGMANIVRALHAVVTGRFEGFREFEPQREQALPDSLSETQKVGAMAEKLIAFFMVPGDIALHLTDKFSGDEPWRS